MPYTWLPVRIITNHHGKRSDSCNCDCNSNSNSNALFFLVSVIILSWVQLSAGAQFEPYTLNGGLVSAVAGRNFCIAASDTRMIGEGGYVLESRNHLSNRLWSVDDDMLMADIEEVLRSSSDSVEVVREIDLEDTSVSQAPIFIGSSGCSTDCCQLQRTVRADIRAASYFGQISRSSPDQVANMLSQTLYERRGFPYYAFCVVSGLDVQRTKGGGNNGDSDSDSDYYCCGKAYVYDAIGSYESVAVAAAGTGRELLQPILDRMFEARSGDNRQVDGTANEAVETLCKAYRAVSEREIGVGDKLVLHISEMNANGKVSRRVLVVPLKQH
jgi:20S proteasome subunit beta 6